MNNSKIEHGALALFEKKLREDIYKKRISNLFTNKNKAEVFYFKLDEVMINDIHVENYVKIDDDTYAKCLMARW